ncbi:MAG: hypothetical protein M1824_004668 [Vezdaea acicularis]|nr:MAG: hypothetical protein M1824_004668 [Vezdaea acicularis]
MTGQVDGSLWYYAPNKVAPIVFAVLIAISGVLHAWQTNKYKSWRYTTLLPPACLIYCAGFIMREVAAHHYKNLGILIAAQCLLYIGPPIYAGANYFILGRTLYYIPYLSPIHPGRVVSTFVGLDVVIEILTAQGISKLANTSQNPSTIHAGSILIKVSLVLQSCLFVGYTAIARTFHSRAKRANVCSANLRTVLYMLYGSTALLFARNVYRTVENFESVVSQNQVPTGPLFTHEAYFWALEASLVTLASYLVNVLFPARYLPKSNKIYLSRDGVTEITGPGWVDKRPLWLTIIDPFDLRGLIKGEDKETAFWDLQEPNQPHLNDPRSLEMQQTGIGASR